METGKPHVLFTLSIISLLLLGSAALAVASGDFLNHNASFSANASYKPF